jgi:CheY-like chemotaxis protein
VSALTFDSKRRGFAPAPILLVEDNPTDVDLTMQAFEEHGMADTLVVCRDGEDALRYIDEHGHEDDPLLPRLVLLDLRMPNVDGLEVLRVMRAHATWKRMPVVVLTTSTEDDDIERAYALGANSYVVKPVDFDAFSELVKTLKLYWCLTNRSPFRPREGRS